jgi:hypothetical protein
LIDRDVAFAQEWFGGTVADGRMSDDELTRQAWRDIATVVTANGPDFVRAFLQHRQKHRCTKNNCQDMNGLVVIPNHEFRAKNAVEAVKKRRSLRAGDTPLSVGDVHENNLYVKYHTDGSVELKRFPLCPYRGSEDDMPPWYASLAIVGG